jgi:hypothetical protein
MILPGVKPHEMDNCCEVVTNPFSPQLRSPDSDGD